MIKIGDELMKGEKDLLQFEQAIEGKCCHATSKGKLCGKLAVIKFVHDEFSPFHPPGAFEHFRCLLHLSLEKSGLTPKDRINSSKILLDVPINEC